MLAPFIILLVVTLGSIRIIRRHDRDLWVPYGPAISLAALWVTASGQMFRPVGAIAAG
jgi:prepilin peptidase CpaA